MIIKKLAVSTFILTLAWLIPSQFTRAQQPAPIGHRQPTAAEVPSNDSVVGDANLWGQAPDPIPNKRSRRGAQKTNIDFILKTPNICYNCND
jgi:hypothetical protein